MKIKEAIKRLRFTIAKQNKPNQTDAEALNEVLKLLEFEQNKTFQDNLLFAKIYAFMLSELTNHYCDVDFANKEINAVLKAPIELIIENLVQSLKRMEMQNYFQQKKILDPFLKTKTAIELEKIHERYKDKIPQLDPIEFIKVGNNWDFNSVKYQLETAVNLSIQNFKANV
jgi:hypothetical protein